MRIGTKLGVLAVVGALALAVAGNAYANTAHYDGQGVNLKPGQTKGLPVLMGFDLSGKKCPKGPKCFKHATMSNFEAVSFAFPNCPNVLDSAFSDFKPDIKVKKNRRFNETGVAPDPSGFDTDVTINGRFKKKGKSVAGSFTATIQGCSTGELTWEATPSD